MIIERKWYEQIYYHLKRKWNDVCDVAYRIKVFWQRGKRGWSDRDAWNFGYYIADVIHDALKHLAKTSHGCPADFARCPYEGESKEICEKCKIERKSKYNKHGCCMCDEWFDKLHEIADGFKRYKDLVLDDELQKMLYEDKGRTIVVKVGENGECDIKCIPTEITKEEWEEYYKAHEEERRKFLKVVEDFGKFFGNFWN